VYRTLHSVVAVLFHQRLRKNSFSVVVSIDIYEQIKNVMMERQLGQVHSGYVPH
jgi:hypothetical protein